LEQISIVHNKILPLIDWCKKVRENGTTKTASSQKKESPAQVKEDINIYYSASSIEFYPTMSFATFGRRALAPAGGVATVATMSLTLPGERSMAAQVVPRLTTKFGETALRPWSQPRKFFTTTRPVSLSNKPASDPVANAAGKEAAKASTETTATTKSSSGGFVAWYEGHLEARPVLTKMFTGSFLWGLGDFVAQVVPQVAAKSENKEAHNDFQYDYPRTTRAVVYGFGMHAPVAHVHYNFLEWMTQRIGVTGLAIPVFKTLMEQVSFQVCPSIIYLFIIADSHLMFCANLVCLLGVGFQCNVLGCHGCPPRSLLQQNLRQNFRQHMGPDDSTVGVLDTCPIAEFSIYPCSSPTERCFDYEHCLDCPA